MGVGYRGEIRLTGRKREGGKSEQGRGKREEEGGGKRYKTQQMETRTVTALRACHPFLDLYPNTYDRHIADEDKDEDEDDEDDTETLTGVF